MALAKTDKKLRNAVSLAIFDLDNTLIAGDSDYLWGEFLVSKGLVDGEHYRRENERYYQAYKRAELDIFAFLRFSLAPLARIPMDQLYRLREEFIDHHIRGLMLPKASALIEQHRQQQHRLLIITATNRFVTEPIAALLNIGALLASEPALHDGKYTGEVAGIPCYKDGKVRRLKLWLQTQKLLAADESRELDAALLKSAVGESWFYSDSQNDAALLELVDHAVAVDPDPTLQALAQQNHWPIISLRQD